MATSTLEERVQKLERTLKDVQAQLDEQEQGASSKKRGWRWFVGIDADNPHFAEAVRLGQEWRFSDRPADDETNK